MDDLTDLCNGQKVLSVLLLLDAMAEGILQTTMLFQMGVEGLMMVASILLHPLHVVVETSGCVSLGATADSVAHELLAFVEHVPEAHVACDLSIGVGRDH